MRTYIRKRLDHKVIEGVEELCRLCLGKAEAPVPLFTDEDDVCATLPLRIRMCVGLEMARNELLPNSICKDCDKEIEHIYKFRQKCEASHHKLKSHMLAMTGQANKKVMAVNNDRQDAVVKQETKQDNTAVTNPTIGAYEIQTTTSDLSLIMSTMLIELGMLRQEAQGLVLVDETLRTVELEGDDNTTIVLQIMEESEEVEIPAIIEENQIQHNLHMKNLDDVVPAVLSPLTKCLEPIPIPKNEQIPMNAPATLKLKEGKEKNKDKNPICPVCGKRFASRNVVARHMSVHTGARPHACRICDRRFAQRAVMLRHELVHKEKRPYACGACPKSFTQRGALEAHARRHALPALALHSCTVCDKVFLYASGLSRHMSTHAGRVFACGSCGKSFSDCSALRRHKRTHDLDKPKSGPAQIQPKSGPAEKQPESGPVRAQTKPEPLQIQPKGPVRIQPKPT